MSIRNIFQRVKSHYQDAGMAGVDRAIHTQLQNSFGASLSRTLSGGTNVFERDWDVLLVLDACRYDLLDEVADEYTFLYTGNTLTSVGSTSAEWLSKTFKDEHADKHMDTAYVTGNPHTASELDASQFLILDEMWRYAWDKESGTIHPRPITDHLIDICRNRDSNRVIGHYMQPHYPFLSDLDIQPSEMQGDVWTALRDGDFSRERVWEAYRGNLRIVLNDIELLLENIDADTVVLTADHGNALGEYGIYGHPPGFPLRVLREVPWVTMEATDERTHETAEYDVDQTVQDGW